MRRMLAALFTLVLAACAAPENTTKLADAAPASGLVASTEMAPPPQAAAPSSSPTRVKSGNAELDLSCKTDADCAVKDVGNCCGTYPMCVNKDSPTDPAGVQAQCRASGRMSVCGFRQVSQCACNAGRCDAVPEPVGGRTDGPVPPPAR